ncbi:MAG: bifunctional adenosylcobinamide kinase/adenosylcobinamide-phosphate guanylyltransferase [Pseudomonadota bacterium]
MRELIVGGVRSGKSAAALARAAAWLECAEHEATLIATATAADEEMRARIARHRAERARRLPRLTTLEEPRALAETVARLSAPRRLVLVECLTLWATNLLAPSTGAPLPAGRWSARVDELAQALAAAAGPVVLVANEIGLGVIGADAATRRFVDAAGELNRRIAAACERVTLVAAGCELPLKAPRP